MKIALMALASFGFATAASAAPATSGDNPFARDEAVLQLSGLDLATADGQQRLAVRMDQAARAVCGEALDRIHLSLERKSQECRAAVKADIRSRIEARTAVASTASATQLAYAR